MFNVGQGTMRLSSFIASTGENEDFVAFMAHSGFAFFVLTIAAHWHAKLLVVAVVATGLAALKEFYFDVHYETTPPQTYADGALDFSGYVTGIILGVLI